ncbi:MAG: hypothetical protein V4437_00590 [Patescibacteria group bacterium]
MSETPFERGDRLWPARKAWGDKINADKKRIFAEASRDLRTDVNSRSLRDASIGALAGAGLGWMIGQLPGAGTGALIGGILGWAKNIGSHGRMINDLFEEPYATGMYLKPGSKEHTERYGEYPE